MVRWQEILQRKEAENSAFSLTLSRGVAHGEEKYVWIRLSNWLETLWTRVQLAMDSAFHSGGYMYSLRMAHTGSPRSRGVPFLGFRFIKGKHRSRCWLPALSVNCRTSMPLGDPRLSSCLAVKITDFGPQLKLKTCLPKKQWYGCFETRMRLWINMWFWLAT